jgi:dolichol-phosphate mannosyltransferase
MIDGYYDGEVGNFCIVNKKIVDIYNSIKDNNKCFTMVLSWMGFRTAYIDLEADERYEGKSSYSFSKKLSLATDILTSQSNKPLKLIIDFGMLIAIMAFIYLFIQIIKRLLYNDVPEGWTSIIASVFLMGGIVLVCMGGIGIYVGNVFNQTKGSPEYLISEILNQKKQNK